MLKPFASQGALALASREKLKHGNHGDKKQVLVDLAASQFPVRVRNGGPGGIKNSGGFSPSRQRVIDPASLPFPQHRDNEA